MHPNLHTDRDGAFTFMPRINPYWEAARLAETFPDLPETAAEDMLLSLPLHVPSTNCGRRWTGCGPAYAQLFED